MGPALLLGVAWVATRAVVLWLLLGRHSWVGGDLAYYAASLRAATDVGGAHTLVEYPLPGVAVIAVPWLLVQLAEVSATYGAVAVALSVLLAPGCCWPDAVRAPPPRPSRWPRA